MKVKFTLALLVLVLLFAAPNALARNPNLADEFQVNLYSARVVEIVEEREIHGTTVQTVRIRILNRDLRDTEATITNTLVGTPQDIHLRPGTRISVHMELDHDGEPAFFFNGYDRANALLILFLIFTVCILVLGRVKGLRALLALIATILLILFGLVPLLLRGYNPIILSILTCVIAAILIFAICYGINKKSISAVIGVAGGLFVAGIIAYLFGVFANITGFASGDAQMLQYLPGGYRFDFRGMLFAGIIIGALGAVTDVAISIASPLAEIKARNPEVTNKELIESGLNIGKDIMGSMVNTLVLAYTGGALATILIFIGFEAGFNEILNLESISTEIVRALAGSIGLLFAMPFTIAAFIFLSGKGVRGDEKTNKNQETDSD
ncbi:MAG: YibE/F family protein [Oscillospiraceae bacterium]|nr:YibE/F family protein [Oscillospiraceae bacterium]